MKHLPFQSFTNYILEYQIDLVNKKILYKRIAANGCGRKHRLEKAPV